MGVYHSRHALTDPLTPEQVRTLAVPLAPRHRRGYRTDDVDALLHRRIRERDEAFTENQRIKNALRTWQSARTVERQDQIR
ncbi:hypothetical protein ACIG87_04960 [Micromonospora sp. NPDC051925]|uniref:hypothetical protein n=1 Tax=Micromonospora sp. NPDC051925 TaxID=3364288 RepID=UPI0037C9EFBA